MLSIIAKVQSKTAVQSMTDNDLIGINNLLLFETYGNLVICDLMIMMWHLMVNHICFIQQSGRWPPSADRHRSLSLFRAESTYSLPSE